MNNSIRQIAVNTKRHIKESQFRRRLTFFRDHLVQNNLCEVEEIVT